MQVEFEVPWSRIVDRSARRLPLSGAEADEDRAGVLLFHGQMFGPRGSPPTQVSGKLLTRH
jgi:hypothetical protein